MVSEVSCKNCGRRFKQKYRTQKFCSIKCANALNWKNQPRPVRLPSYSVDLAELLGIIFGDGYLSKYHFSVYLNKICDKEYSYFVVDLIKGIFRGIHVGSNVVDKNGVIVIQVSSKKICEYLRNIGFNPVRKIPRWIERSQDFMKPFIRGLFDTEGSVGFKRFAGRRGKYLYKQLIVTSRNKNLLDFLPKGLKKLGFSPTMNSRKNIYISNQKDIKRFVQEIGLHNPKLINKIALEDQNGFGIRRGRGAQKWKRGRADECAALEMR